MTDPALVLLSGGLDSTVALAETLGRDGHPVTALAIDYGQRHVRETAAAQRVCTELGVTLRLLDLRGYRTLGGSALTDTTQGLPTGSDQAATVVPGRNALLLAAAAGAAQAWGFNRVVAGMHGGDHATYPDCRPDFLAPLATALWNAYDVRLQTPLLSMTKAEVVLRGRGIGAPLGLTWSCYDGGYHHCGTCGACTARRAAFLEAAVTDPTVYAAP